MLPRHHMQGWGLADVVAWIPIPEGPQGSKGGLGGQLAIGDCPGQGQHATFGSIQPLVEGGHSLGVMVQQRFPIAQDR
jgi:hypothetical protein